MRVFFYLSDFNTKNSLCFYLFFFWDETLIIPYTLKVKGLKEEVVAGFGHYFVFLTITCLLVEVANVTMKYLGLRQPEGRRPPCELMKTKDTPKIN